MVTDKKEPSLRTELTCLVDTEDTDRASGYNAALQDVLAILDRHENDRQRRSAHAIARRKAAGKKTGGDVPYGYKLAHDGETLLECSKEQLAIATARKLRTAGHSLREVARRLLKVRGIVPREGAKFHAAQILRMLDEDK